MFGTKQNNGGFSKNGSMPAGSTVNWIGAGSTIEGIIQCDGDIRIDGSVRGSVVSHAKVVIGDTGEVEGDITCQQADVSGRVHGTLAAAEVLTLNATSRIEGDIRAIKLVVEPGAVFNGNCSMQGAIKTAARERAQAESEAAE